MEICPVESELHIFNHYIEIPVEADVDGMKITNQKDIMTIGKVGSDRYITLNKINKKINAGCFHGSLREFKAAVYKKYNKRPIDYKLLYPFIETYFKSK